MDDLISRQAAIDAVNGYRPPKPKHETSMEEVNRIAWDCAINCAEMALKALPPAEPQRKKGTWLILPLTDAWIYMCDQCGHRTDFNDFYCSNCGAVMRGV